MDWRSVIRVIASLCITSPLHADRIKFTGESERLLAAGERGR